MKCWIPVCRRVADAPPGRDLFGGRPSKFPEGRWPRCNRCGTFQTLVAQLGHSEARLDLGRDAKLFVFQCFSSRGCPSFEARGGANAVMILEAESLQEAWTPPPIPETLLSAWVVDHYREAFDDVPIARYAAFRSQRLYESLEDEVRESVYEGTKLGGLPAWLQDADQHPGPSWRLAAQLNEFLEVERTEDAPTGSTYRFGDRIRADWGANFGGGAAWVFLPNDPRPTSGLMVWQP